MAWDPEVLPDQTGTTVVVTGANAGIGYFISEQLAAAGAHVVMACRSEERAAHAMAAIRRRVRTPSIEFLALDTSDSDSVRAAADALAARDQIDVLIENAGTVNPPAKRETDARGNELVLSTNVLGHFQLAALMLPTLARNPGSRIITLGSMVTRLSTFRVDDLQLIMGYSGWRAYAQSKIELQSFGFELDRRLRMARVDVASIVAHPGYSLGGRTPRVAGVNEPDRLKKFGDNLLAVPAQGKDRGAWAPVRAAIDPDATGGQYYGPQFITRGLPVLQHPTVTSADPAIGARLWRQLEVYSGQRFDV